MVLVKTPYGDFLEPPYTDEENWEFEQRLRRGGDITIIHGSKRKAGKRLSPTICTSTPGGEKMKKLNEQSHTTGTAGESPALLSQDPQGNGVPIPSGEGPDTVPDARRAICEG